MPKRSPSVTASADGSVAMIHNIDPSPEIRGLRFMSEKAVCDATTLSASQVRRLALDGKFPKPVSVSAHRRAWVESEVVGWLKERINEREGEAA